MHLTLSVWSHGHPARVAELADALASGASVLIGRAGSSPAPGTISPRLSSCTMHAMVWVFCVAGLNRGYPMDHTFGRNLAIRSVNPCLGRVGGVRIGLS